MLLEELSLEIQLDKLYEDMSSVMEPTQQAPKKLGAINVDYSQMSLPELQQLMQQTLKLMSIHGTMKPGPMKERHASRIMVFLNKIRAAVHNALKNETNGMTESKREIFEQFLSIAQLKPLLENAISIREMERIQRQLEQLGVRIERKYILELIDQLLDMGVKIQDYDKYGRPQIDLSALTLPAIKQAVNELGLYNVVQFTK